MENLARLEGLLQRTTHITNDDDRKMLGRWMTNGRAKDVVALGHWRVAVWKREAASCRQELAQLLAEWPTTGVCLEEAMILLGGESASRQKMALQLFAIGKTLGMWALVDAGAETDPLLGLTTRPIDRSEAEN